MSVHEFLKELSPCGYSSLPEDDQELAEYVRNALSRSQQAVDSVPPQPPLDTSSNPSNGVGAASSANGVKRSAATHDAPVDEELRKAWGKPLKLSAKENPYEMAVYKMAAKDRRGAWFARRSVHEGLGFARWKRSLETEFEDSLEVQGKPGEGNVRGIGGDKKLMSRSIPHMGRVQVLQLTAQFPGPSAPRDFVELLISSSTHPTDKDAPRQYLLISRPVKHPDAPEQDGFVRGTYESIEFIREIPIRKTKIVPTTGSPDFGSHEKKSNGNDGAEPSKEGKDAASQPTTSADLAGMSTEDAEATIEARQAQDGHTPTLVSQSNTEDGGKADSGVPVTVDDNDELSPNPVEWIMITRSDPGGSVPRFLVERGTPSAIVSDASKFLDWATQRSMPVVVDGSSSQSQPADNNERSTSSEAVAAARSAQPTLTRTVTADSDSSSGSSSSDDSFVSADGGETAKAKAKQIATSSDPAADDKYARQEDELARKLEARRTKAEQQLEAARDKYGERKNGQDKIRSAEEKRDRRLAEAEAWHDRETERVRQRREKAERRRRESGSKAELRERIGALAGENAELRRRIAELEGGKGEVLGESGDEQVAKQEREGAGSQAQ